MKSDSIEPLLVSRGVEVQLLVSKRSWLGAFLHEASKKKSMSMLVLHRVLTALYLMNGADAGAVAYPGGQMESLVCAHFVPKSLLWRVATAFGFVRRRKLAEVVQKINLLAGRYYMPRGRAVAMYEMLDLLKFDPTPCNVQAVERSSLTEFDRWIRTGRYDG